MLDLSAADDFAEQTPLEVPTVSLVLYQDKSAELLFSLEIRDPGFVIAPKVAWRPNSDSTVFFQKLFVVKSLRDYSPCIEEDDIRCSPIFGTKLC